MPPPTSRTPDRDAHNGGYQNLYVSALPSVVKDADLQALFEPFGVIKSAKVMLDCNSGISRGYGFVLFEKEQQGCLAYAKLNGTVVQCANTSFTVHIAASQHAGHAAAVESSIIYVRNIPTSCTDGQISDWFCGFGTVTGFVLKPDASTTEYKLATVEFKTVSAAREAIAKTHNTMCFPQCTDRPVLAKFADSTELKASKRNKREQSAVGAVQATGGLPAAAQRPAVPIPIPFSAPPGYGPSSGGGNSFGEMGGNSAGPNINSSPLATGFAVLNQTQSFYPGYTPLPLEARTGFQQIYYQGVLGIAPDGRLYPVQPEKCHYVSLNHHATMPGGAPVFAYSPLPSGSIATSCAWPSEVAASVPSVVGLPQGTVFVLNSTPTPVGSLMMPPTPTAQPPSQEKHQTQPRAGNTPPQTHTPLHPQHEKHPHPSRGDESLKQFMAALNGAHHGHSSRGDQVDT